MIYLNPFNNFPISHSIKILPRVTDISTSDILTVFNQSTGKDIAITFTTATYDVNDILTLVFTTTTSDPLKEGNFYTIKVTRNITGVLLWSGVAFASSQDKDDYTINKDEFKEKTSNNEYIILE